MLRIFPPPAPAVAEPTPAAPWSGKAPAAVRALHRGSRENSVEAVEKYRAAAAAGEPLDVVILDLTVRAGMGGAEALQRLRELDPSVEAVMASGYSGDAIVSEHWLHGFRDFLKKPFAIADLQAVVNPLPE